ncbi:MAG: prephenate dehydrogenase/arogenate dehydrogenase family protein [Verrucomicrobia bacterium]|nr:prephenate dehydrogenase/arogenate dehydrogenase family protein [Verrucomicrobiota bacterium]
MHWKKVTLVGVGLLGGSLGLALRKRRLASAVVGFVRREASVGECEQAGAVSFATTDLRRAVGAIVTDVGSVKGGVVRELTSSLARIGVHFVGSHPMAGSERTGVAAARADLFVNAACVVTPARNSNKAAVRKVQQLWKRCYPRAQFQQGGRAQSAAALEIRRLARPAAHSPGPRRAG